VSSHSGSGHESNSGGSPEGTRNERPRLALLFGTGVRTTEPGYAESPQRPFMTIASWPEETCANNGAPVGSHGPIVLVFASDYRSSCAS